MEYSDQNLEFLIKNIPNKYFLNIVKESGGLLGSPTKNLNTQYKNYLVNKALKKNVSLKVKKAIINEITRIVNDSNDNDNEKSKLFRNLSKSYLENDNKKFEDYKQKYLQIKKYELKNKTTVIKSNIEKTNLDKIIEKQKLKIKSINEKEQANLATIKKLKKEGVLLKKDNQKQKQLITKQKEQIINLHQKINKIIWAPHHSILKDDTLDYSNFLNIAEDMLNIASKYKDYIQIAFKPHPHLKRKLYKMQGWGIEKTNQYYLKWNELPNTILVEGDYIDLFMTSDAMIHDCSSFSVEYLYVNKPVLYLTKNNHLDFLCNFGEMAFNMHYKGSTVGDVEKFLKNVVLDGCDSMKMQRNMFMIKYLLPSHGINVAENMFNEVVAPWNK